MAAPSRARPAGAATLKMAAAAVRGHRAWRDRKFLPRRFRFRRVDPGPAARPPAMLPLVMMLLVPPVLPGTVEVTRPRGVSLSNLHFYEPSGPFTCLDGSATISFSWVNDDYCDCRDGSDEPGTAACPNGHFHCTNAGYRPHSIPSAHVNDGICDCCDGTDEYDSGTNCENTCRERGRREREQQQRLAQVAQEGFALREQLVREAAAARKDKEERLGGLQEARGGLEQRVGTLRAAKEAAEGPEREAREEQRRRGEEQRAAAEAARADEAFAELDSDGDGQVTVAELRLRPELDTDGDGAVSEDEAQALMGDTTPLDAAAFRDRLWATLRERYRPQGQTEPPPPPPEPPLEENPPEEEEDEDEAEEEEEEEEESEGPEEELKVPPPQPPEEKGGAEELPPLDAAAQALVDAAQRARQELEEAERALKETEESIRALEQELAFDFGPEGEFSYLYNQCYELGTSEYIYRLCPFKRVSQKPKHGGAETNLGTWGAWAGPEHDRFSTMKYEHGTGCWQGPNRATTVKLSCGTETAVTATTEPSRCEYLMELVTPAACRAPPPAHDDHDEL
ncbi:glucosidase 2 subunit beta isoform X2 [Patagioenas fasciata]|uniref:glucosidase 2 subunit beta isoform X2 n=1 Tax=Patagioenas fasciata TaxID=372321 RepID=UPI003A9A62AB